MVEAPSPTVVLDIDQTLAGGVVPAHMHLYNKMLKLGMTDDEIAATAAHAKTFDVDQIRNYRAQGQEAEDKFQEVRGMIRTSDVVHANLSPIKDSQVGVERFFSNKGLRFGGYYTVRPNEVENATKRWLEDHNYPDSGNVVMCSDKTEVPGDKLAGERDKIRKIIENLIIPDETGGVVVLIDDNLEKLLKAAQQMAIQSPEIAPYLRRLVVVGFGIPDNSDTLIEGGVDIASGVRCLNLPSWRADDLQRLIQTISGLRSDTLFNSSLLS